MNADQSDPLPVALHPAGAQSASAAVGAPQAGAPGQSVGGVSNLRTGE
ncbi:conserved hypothetical protein [Burkholderia mallei PRL-20]|nr:conserved hypothetical protein [Burkholderia mallei PRL-20]